MHHPVKPFAFAELLARVEALARRSDSVVEETVLRAGDLESDLVSRTVSRGGRTSTYCHENSSFSCTWFAIKARLSRGRCCCSTIWHFHFDPTTNILDVYVSRVRRKVDAAQAYPLIHTVRGVGFCVRAPGEHLYGPARSSRR